MTHSKKYRVFLISQRFGRSAGGEAIKAAQYADYLLSQGYDVTVFTHERSRGHGVNLDPDRLVTIPDTPLQLLLWRFVPLRGLLGPHFHWKIRPLVLDRAAIGPAPVLHYISPVSPVALRFPPKGFETVLGPLTGNIYYPPAFRTRMSWMDRMREALHRVTQRLQRLTFAEKARFNAILVSGYTRTRASLLWAGARQDQMHDVVDAGVSEALFNRPRIVHRGVNQRFVVSGRMVDHKGTDLAIRALTLTDAGVTLDIYGDGETRPRLESLVAELGLAARVSFKGWLPGHDALLDALGAYRGYLFPSLAEANGIVMQEAMALGLPVVALNWGGPGMLADARSAIYIDPTSEADVVKKLAEAMERLSRDGDLAESLSQSARTVAEKKFTWSAAAESWLATYPR